MDKKPSLIAIVINDVIYDQRMIRICTSLSQNFEVALWGRAKSAAVVVPQPYQQKRFRFMVNKGPLFYLMFNLRIFWKLIFSSFDVIHAVDLDTLPAAYFACKLKGKKLVYDSHEYFTEVPELIERPVKRAVWLRLEAYLIPKISNALTVSQGIAEAYYEKYRVAFEVIRNCPVSFDLASKKKDKKYLLYQGALNKGRGLEATIEAMQDLPILLYIAGNGDIKEELVRHVAELKLEDKVIFLGELNPIKLRDYTLGAFAGINVADNLGLSYYLSLNNKFFDYIQCGIPAITMPFPEYKWMESEYQCGCLAAAEQNEIKKAVNLLLSDSEFYGILRKNCLIARQIRTWDNEEKSLLKFYANLT